MSAEWQTVRIGDLGKVVTGKTPSTTISENFGGDYPFITIPDLDERREIKDSARTLSELGAQAMRSCRLPPDAVLMSCIATIGKCGITTRISFTNQQINSLICKDGVDPKFVYYSFTQLGKALEAAGGGGSVYTNVSKSRFEAIEIKLPSLKEQKFVAAMLSKLDDKIDINRRINQTLEAMAQAIFKSWFVDFDPVKAKIAAKQEGRNPLRAAMSTISGKLEAELDTLPPEQFARLKATATLFPDEMEESELGDIPRGWEVQRVGNLLELAYGKALKSTDRQEGVVPVYGSGGITGYHNTALVPNRSIVVGRKGTVGSLYWEDEPFFPIDTTYYVRPLTVPLTYCYYAMQTLGLEKMNTDAAVPGLNRENVYRLELVRPDSSVLQKFDAEVLTLRKAIRANSDANKMLTNLRDTLLPKLLSGELSVASSIAEVDA